MKLLKYIFFIFLISCSKSDSEITIDDTVSGVEGVVRSFDVIKDPYEVLSEYYNAIGGLEKVKGEITYYGEGSIEIVGSGLEGSFSEWHMKPLKNRQEIDLGIITQVIGDNGEYAWEVDHNGKLNIKQDENTLKEREVERLFEEFEHLDPESEYFILTYEGIESLTENDCYVIKTENTINENIQYEFYDTSSYLLIKTIDEKINEVTNVYYSDYRDVDGNLHPYRVNYKITEPINQEILLIYERYDVNLDIDSVIFEPPEEDVVDFIFENGKSVENLKFDFIEDHIFFFIEMGSDSIYCILDCGAGATLIDSSFADKLGLEIEGNIEGAGAGNIINISITTLPSYRIDGLILDEQKIITSDIDWLIRKIMDINSPIILGYDFLSRFITRIDYANELISFYDPDSFIYSGEGVIIDAPLENNLFTLPMKVDEEYKGKWTLDIGAGGCSFNYPFAEANGLLELEGVQRVAWGAGGDHYSVNREFEKIEFGSFELENIVISIPSEKGEGAFASEGFCGNIGNNLLRNFILYLDYENQRIIIEKGDNFGQLDTRDKSGLSLWYNDEGDVEVYFVSPGTPGEKSGFVKGDVILTVDGIHNRLFEIRKLFEEESGVKYRFVISRGGEEIELEIVLEDLY